MHCAAQAGAAAMASRTRASMDMQHDRGRDTLLALLGCSKCSVGAVCGMCRARGGCELRPAARPPAPAACHTASPARLEPPSVVLVDSPRVVRAAASKNTEASEACRLPRAASPTREAFGVGAARGELSDESASPVRAHLGPGTYRAHRDYEYRRSPAPFGSTTSRFAPPTRQARGMPSPGHEVP